MKNKPLPTLSEARKRLDDNVKSTQARALGSVRVAWGDLAVLRDALIAGETLARDVKIATQYGGDGN
jgi:hypothetical protein